MFARAKWGVFGTYCLQDVILKDCDINRFDIHCYGKNIKAEGCRFTGMYNQFSSVYGYIAFDNCVFTDFTPVLIESSFNAYTPFELSFKRCKFNFNKQHNYVLTLFGVPQQENERPELKQKSLPNITMKNCKIRTTDEIEKWYLIWTGGDNWKGRFGHIRSIKITGLKCDKEDGLCLFSEKVKTENSMNVKVNSRKWQMN